jgi:hypothetical protein
MARIRTVKPEFWTSEQVATCSPSARLLFIGLWSFCDDGGVHPASIKRLKMEVFPADALDDGKMEGLIGELVRADLIREFDADGERFWHVTGWSRHQKIERPTIRHPRPPEGSANPPSIRRDLDDHSSNARRDVVESSLPEWKGVESNGNGIGVEQEKKSPKLRFTDDDKGLAQEMFSLIRELNPNAKEPDLDQWANEFRLMRERDGKDRTVEGVRDLMRWSLGHSFWKSNILSPAALRKQWDRLVIQRKEQHDPRRTTSSKPDGLYREAPQLGRRTF